MRMINNTEGNCSGELKCMRFIIGLMDYKDWILDYPPIIGNEEEETY